LAGDLYSAGNPNSLTSRKSLNSGGAQRDVYIYFDNDHKSAAPADALKLQRLLK
jgi:uncharacterized protein YecE (DUF72 family)